MIGRLDWRLLIEPAGRPAAENMALDSALLHQAADAEGVAFLRLYRWNPPALSFGRNEPASRRYDRDRVRALGLDAVRRPTGGRAVWHDDEVTYAVAAPAGAFGTLRDTYAALHRLVVAALGRLGVVAGVADVPSGRHPGPGAGACFAASAGGEVVLEGRKVVGSAQVRQGPAFLQHGSILLSDDQPVVSSVERGTQSTPKSTSLSSALGRRVSFGEVATAVAAEARLRWDATWTEGSIDPDPALVARYADPAWTWRR